MTASGTIDITGLMEASGDDRELAISLVQLFFDLTQGEMDLLAEAIQNDRPSTVSSIAHKCAGSSIACGMTRLATLLKTLEMESKPGMPTNVSAQLEEILEEMRAVKLVLERHFNCSF